MAISPQKMTRMKYGSIIGTVVGIAMFGALYAMNNSFIYVFFIPLVGLMGFASQYVKDEEE